MTHIYTAADFQNTDTADLYRELHKEIHGVKYRGVIDPDSAAHFMNNYDVYFQEEMARERQELDAYGDLHGRHFANWMEYYDFKETEFREEFLAKSAAELQAQKEALAYNRRGSTEAAVEDFLDCLSKY